MTDNEIIKTLECLCGGGDSCAECAYHKKYRFDECRKQVAKDALDLIKRQQVKFIELPCKVGDIVYLVDFEYGIYKCIVNDIRILSDNEPVYTLYFYSQNGDEPAELEWDIDIERDCFGKTVFLTKEAAEAKLQEFNENENA